MNSSVPTAKMPYVIDEEPTFIYPLARENPSLANKFANFDDPTAYSSLERKARDGRSKNFVLDFSKEQAWCAFDVDTNTLESLHRLPRPPEIEFRWIHIWGPHLQKEILKQLQSRYLFTPRLVGLMCSTPRFPRSRDLSSRRSHDGHRFGIHGHSNKQAQQHTRVKLSMESSLDPDLELAPNRVRSHAATARSQRQQEEAMLESLNHYDVVDSIWHWSSVDYGHAYLCAGYNSLYNVRDPLKSGEKDQSRQDLPNGDRIWSWLIICGDKTVISIVEGIVPQDASLSQFIDASASRRNMLNVFQQMSTANTHEKRNAISLVPIRHTMDGAQNLEQNSLVDACGLLFYYLFDDWYATYSLLAKHEHLYKAALNTLRQRMMSQASLSHVESLHRIGRQLSVLKRIYQSYELVIDRILERPSKLVLHRDSVNLPAPSQQMSVVDMDSSIASLASAERTGVFLSLDARFRFERLRDRIRLYAVSEIQESIDLKDSLVNMNFNLISIKESNSVERLTRITILLAKATILFLPVSLMTAYFSTQLTNVKFTVKAYWISFVVTLAASFLLLLIFGQISGTREADMVYQPINRILINIGKNTLGRLGRIPGRRG